MELSEHQLPPLQSTLLVCSRRHVPSYTLPWNGWIGMEGHRCGESFELCLAPDAELTFPRRVAEADDKDHSVNEGDEWVGMNN